MLHSTKSTNFSLMYYFFIMDKMGLRAGWNGFAGRTWSEGRSLETTVLQKCCNSVEQWFPKWAVPPPWGRWETLRGGEAEMGDQGAVKQKWAVGGNRRPS